MDKFSDFQLQLESIIENFDKNLSSVEELLEFDQTILQFCLKKLRDLEDGLRTGGFKNQYLSAQQTIKAIENIKSHGSTKIKYQTISNQSLVLTVSHFASAVHDLFKSCINFAFKNNLSETLNKEELKFKVKELADLDLNIENRIGEIISQKNNISFQDMKSIQRCFKEYFKYQIEKTKHVNNIIFGQACRHAIVHNGAKADNSLINQLKSTTPNNLNINLNKGDLIHFKNEELKVVMESMNIYLSDLSAGMINHWQGQNGK